MNLPALAGQPPTWEARLNELRQDGPRRFARWDATLFENLVAGPVHALATALSGQSDAEVILAAYLGLLHQGVGITSIRQAKTDFLGWNCYLERCLVEQIPALLPAVPSWRRLPLLVKVWNLGEGLQREPAWLDRYVTASAAGLTNLEDMESFLTRTLEPVLSPSRPATWKGPFTVTVLDLRPIHDEFLPGEMVLAAPSVLRVADRRHKGREMGILLGSGGRSKPLGMMNGLGEFRESGDRPTVTFQDDKIQVVDQSIAMPYLRRCHRHLITRSGFIAASAVDSQRLWIVESP